MQKTLQTNANERAEGGVTQIKEGGAFKVLSLCNYYDSTFISFEATQI